MLAGLLVAAASPPSLAGSPSKWKEALARYRAGHAEWDRFLQEVYNPAVDELERRAPRPPYSFTVTARNAKVLEFMHDRNDPDQWKYCVSPSIKAKGEALAEAWRKWQIDQDAIRQEIGFSAIVEEDSRRSKKIDALRDELIATRVGSPAEMLEKLEIVWGDYDDPEPHKEELFRDFRALALSAP